MSIKDLKIAVVHDHLGFSGGGERTVLLMALRLNADFITAYTEPSVFPELQSKLGDRLKVLTKTIIYTRVVRFFWLRGVFWWKRKMFKEYDILIASSQTATEVVANYAKAKTVRMVYTHTTPRRVFDLYAISKQMYPFFLRPAYAVFARFWKYLYLKAIKKFNVNIANSNNVRQRIKEHTKSDVNAVIWPPITIQKFNYESTGDYYLSFGRLDEAKRIELIVEAFQKMPDKKLVVCSGGPRLQKIKNMSKGYDNIEVRGWVEDNELVNLVNNCIASIYIPIDEDAGMTHLETNAAGKPYLGVREGGLIESTIEGETGILVPADPGVDDIIAGINKMSKEWCIGKKDICIAHAKKYDEKRFYQQIEKLVKANDPNVPVFGIDASRREDPRFPGEHKRTGVEVVSCNLIQELVSHYQAKGPGFTKGEYSGKAKKLSSEALELSSNSRLRLYTPRTIQSLPLNIQKVIPAQKGWTRKALDYELKTSPIDYFLTSGYYIPKNAPKNSYAIIHDVIFKTNPELYGLKERIRQDIVARLNIKRARKIFTVSNKSKIDIVNYYGVNESDVVVARIGAPLSLRGMSESERRGPESSDGVNNPENVAPVPGLPQGFASRNDKQILYIGRIEKKKSIDILIRAFNKFSQNNPNWQLKLAGSDGNGAEEIKALAKENKQIKFLGYVSEEEKLKLLANAFIYVHPSSHEGATLPILEAMQAGTPVIASDAAVIKEYGGDAIEYFKYGDVESLLDKIKLFSKDKQKQQDMVAAGYERLKEFSWEKMAMKISKEIFSK